MNKRKRVVSGLLSLIMAFGLLPPPVAANVVGDIATGQTYNIHDNGSKNALFLERKVGGSTFASRKIWAMYTTLPNGQTAHAYCLDHSKTNPTRAGKVFTVDSKVNDQRVYGIATLKMQPIC